MACAGFVDAIRSSSEQEPTERGRQVRATTSEARIETM